LAANMFAQRLDLVGQAGEVARVTPVEVASRAQPVPEVPVPRVPRAEERVAGAACESANLFAVGPPSARHHQAAWTGNRVDADDRWAAWMSASGGRRRTGA